MARKRSTSSPTRLALSTASGEDPTHRARMSVSFAVGARAHPAVAARGSTTATVRRATVVVVVVHSLGATLRRALFPSAHSHHEIGSRAPLRNEIQRGRRPRDGHRGHRGHRRDRRSGHVRRHQPPGRRGGARVRRRRHPLRRLQLSNPVQGHRRGTQAVRGIVRRHPRRHALHRRRVHRRRRRLRRHDVVRRTRGRTLSQRSRRVVLSHQSGKWQARVRAGRRGAAVQARGRVLQHHTRGRARGEAAAQEEARGARG